PIRISKVPSAHAQWPVFGEQITGGSASTRPAPVTQRKTVSVAHELNNGRSESDGQRGRLISRNIGDAPMSTRKSPV
ncbi:hypothetical protein PQQ84_35110, partial [Paraburkholderia strydomiana]|uniref:hypothetical protein n=1 Tax=Paraburkholderia strydomiana TaxID=1245417 RepID=UPI0038BA0352